MFSLGVIVDENELDARERILNATIDLLNAEPDVDKITVRRIAERAGVGIGLINYHFQSKENLFNEVVTASFGALEDQWRETLAGMEADPVTKLKTLLKVNAKVAISNPRLAHITVSHIVLHREIDVPYVILPLLKEFYGAEKSETELKMIAVAIVITMQVAFLRTDAFRRYIGIDVYDDEQRDQWIDTFVDTLVTK